MSSLQLQFTCTIHNLRYGFDRPQQPKVEPALLNCPQCAFEQSAKLLLEIITLKEHRDLLLQVIDLKKTIQPLKED